MWVVTPSGFDQLRPRLSEYPPERVAKHHRAVCRSEIVELAHAYATTRPAVIRLLIGMEHRSHGAMAYRTIACLPALVGAWRERGGGLLSITGRLRMLGLNLPAVEMPQLERLSHPLDQHGPARPRTYRS